MKSIINATRDIAETRVFAAARDLSLKHKLPQNKASMLVTLATVSRIRAARGRRAQEAQVLHLLRDFWGRTLCLLSDSARLAWLDAQPFKI